MDERPSIAQAHLRLLSETFTADVQTGSLAALHLQSALGSAAIIKERLAELAGATSFRAALLARLTEGARAHLETFATHRGLLESLRWSADSATISAFAAAAAGAIAEDNHLRELQRRLVVEALRQGVGVPSGASTTTDDEPALLPPSLWGYVLAYMPVWSFVYAHMGRVDARELVYAHLITLCVLATVFLGHAALALPSDDGQDDQLQE